MSKKAFPKKVFVWWEDYNPPFLMVSETMAGVSLPAGEKTNVAEYELKQTGDYMLSVAYVPKGAKVKP